MWCEGKCYSAPLGVLTVSDNYHLSLEREKRGEGGSERGMEGRRGREWNRERIHGHMPFHLIQQPLTAIHEGEEVCLQNMPKGRTSGRKNSSWAFPVRTGMSAATPHCRSLSCMEFLSTKESTARGEGKSWVRQIPWENNGVSEVSGNPTMRIKDQSVLHLGARPRCWCLLLFLPLNLY